MNAHSPKIPDAISDASSCARISRDSGAANASRTRQIAVDAYNVHDVTVRARSTRRAWSSSSNQNRTNASPIPNRSRIDVKMIAVSRFSA